MRNSKNELICVRLRTEPNEKQRLALRVVQT